MTGYANGQQNQMLKKTIKTQVIMFTRYPGKPPIQNGPGGTILRCVRMCGKMAKK